MAHAARSIFTTAAEQLLTRQDRKAFKATTGVDVQLVMRKAAQLSQTEILDALELGSSGKTGHIFETPLNADGFYLLRWLIARRFIDAQRVANGWLDHPDFKEFQDSGIIQKPLDNWPSNGMIPTLGMRLTAGEDALLRLASGYSPVGPLPYAGCEIKSRDGGYWTLRGNKSMTFSDKDDQYQMHVDAYMPVIKFFVFTEDVAIEKGPFHYVPGSHKLSERKMRWLWDRLGRDPFLEKSATRHVNQTSRYDFDWCSESHECLQRVYRHQQHDLAAKYGFPLPKPMVVKAGTLIIADTSGYHFRGIGEQGRSRASMASVYYTCGKKTVSTGKIISSTPRIPALACANGSAALHKPCEIYFRR